MRLSTIWVTVRACLIGLSAVFPAFAAAQEKPVEVKPFLDALWPDAAKRGISRKTFDAALAGFTLDQRVIATTTRQPEYGTAVGTYVNRMASAVRIEGAARNAEKWKHTLDAIEKQYGVDRWIVVALWGIETSFGANTGGFDVIRSLATLSLSGYRPDYFRDEFIAALKILQDGHIAREQDDRLVGRRDGTAAVHALEFRYAGGRFFRRRAQGHLGQCAGRARLDRELSQTLGLESGRGWGYEAVIPQGFDYRHSRATYAEWSALGIKRADGKAMPDGNAILLFPSGASGPAFLVSENFEVIKRYNISDVFALAAGHLSDRARGAAPFRGAWPADDPQLSRGQRIALQKKLKELGHPVKDTEGRIDFDLRDAIRVEQAKYGMIPDGHPTADCWNGSARASPATSAAAPALRPS